MVTTSAASLTGECGWLCTGLPHLMYSAVEDRTGLPLAPLIVPSSSGISTRRLQNNPSLPSSPQTPPPLKRQYMRLFVTLMVGRLLLAHRSVSFACGTLDLGNERVTKSFFQYSYADSLISGKLVGHTDNIRAILISEDAKYVCFCLSPLTTY
jgi:hypothetical protein